MAKTISRQEILALLGKSISEHWLMRGNGRQQHGFSQPFVSLVRSGHKLPSERLCGIFGYRPIVTQTITYEKLG